MTPEQIITIVTGASAPIAGAVTLVMRWTSAAGKALRELRDELDDWTGYAYRLRRHAIREGLDEATLPEPPPPREK